MFLIDSADNKNVTSYSGILKIFPFVLNMFYNDCATEYLVCISAVKISDKILGDQKVLPI